MTHPIYFSDPKDKVITMTFRLIVWFSALFLTLSSCHDETGLEGINVLPASSERTKKESHASDTIHVVEVDQME